MPKKPAKPKVAGRNVFYSISFKLLVSFLVVAMLPAGVISYYLLGRLFSGVDRLEQDKMDDSVTRAERSLRAQGDEMVINVLDYAHWDDMALPETGHDPDWLDINVLNWVPGHFNIDAIMIAETDGTVYSSYLPPEELSSSVSNLVPFQEALKGNERQWFIMTSRGLMLMVAGYISRTSQEGVSFPPSEATGVLIYARLLSSKMAEDVSRVVGRDIALFDSEKLVGINEAGSIKEGTSFAEISSEAQKAVARKLKFQEETANELFAYVPLISPDQMVVGAMRVGQLRLTENFVRREIVGALRTSLVIGLLLTVALGLFLGLRLSKPIKNLARIMVDYGAGKRVEIPKDSRKDEIGILTRSYISMVQSLEENKRFLLERDKELEKINRELRSSTANLDQAKKDLENKVKEVERINRVMVGRELRMVELKKEIAELKAKVEGRG